MIRQTIRQRGCIATLVAGTLIACVGCVGEHEPTQPMRAGTPVSQPDSIERESSVTYASRFRILLDGGYGYIDSAGTVIIGAQFAAADKFAEGLAYVHYRESDSSMSTGYINTSGTMVFLSPSASYRFSEGLAPIEIEERWAFMDRTGKIILRTSFPVVELLHGQLDYVPMFSDGLATVAIEIDAYPHHLYGYIDASGEVVIPTVFRHARGFSEGLAAVAMDTEHRFANVGYVDTSGQMVIEPRYVAGEEFSEGYASVRLDSTTSERWVFINRDGHQVGDLVYEAPSFFSEGLAAVMINGKWGFMDTTGTLAIPARYDRAREFSEGLAAVNVNADYMSGLHPYGGEWGYINHQGEFVIPPEPWNEATSFANGLAHTAYVAGGRTYRGYINQSGNQVWWNYPYW